MWNKLWLSVVLFGWCPVVVASVQIDGVAAYVDAHVITVSDVLGASSTLQQQLREGRSGRAANDLYREVLEELIARKLIVDAYEHQREIQIPPMMIDARVQEVIQELFRGDRNAFLRALGEEGRSERNWREEIREQVVVRAMRNLRVDRHVHISPTEMRAFYDANQARFSQPGSVTYRMLVLGAAGDDPEAVSTGSEQVAAALQAGEDFADVVRRFSVDRFAEQGGLRGPVDPVQLREEVRNPLMEMDVGAVLGPLALGENQFWLQLVQHDPAQQLSFAEAYDQIEMLLFRERAEALYDAWLARLRAAAFVTVAVETPF